MKSKTSFINKGIFINDCKRFLWVGLVYLLGLLLTIPIKMLMLYSQEKTFSHSYDLLNNPYLRIFEFGSEYQVLLTLVIPVLTGLLLFHYLQTDKTADMIHTLPIKRETLYNTNLLAGSMLLIVPIVITALISLIVINSTAIAYITTADILTWTGISILINLFLFVTCAFIGIFTGTWSMQGALTYILLLLPVGLASLLLHNLSLFLYGFAHSYYRNININSLSPLTRFIEFSYRPFTGTEIWAYILIILALYFIGKYFYKQRKLEMAGNAITFQILCPIFKYGLTFCSMLLFGSYFSSMQNGLNWTFFGYFIGSFLGYFIAEIIIKKSFYVFKLAVAKGYIAFALIMAITITGLSYDVTGFEKRLPDIADIKEVYFDSSFISLQRPVAADEKLKDMLTDTGFYHQAKPYQEKDNIEKIRQLHQKLLADKKSAQNKIYNHNIPQRDVCIAYKLKNDKVFYRQYHIRISDYAPSLKPIYESPEYKHHNYIILSVKPENVDLIEINAENIGKSVKLTDPVLITEAIGKLKVDALNHTFEQMTAGNPAWATIRILLDDQNQINISWDKSDVQFGKWLESIEKYNDARIMATDIEYAAVFLESADINNQSIKSLNIDEYLAIIRLKQDYLKITAPEQLETLLTSYVYEHLESDYRVIFMLKNGHSINGGIRAEAAPDSIKTYFAKQ